jgi:hypothetical protein
MAKSTIVINGMTITAEGRSVSVRDGRVIVDGKDVTPEAKEIVITVTGDIERLEVGACNTVSIGGNVGSVKCQTGDVEVRGDIRGDASSQTGDINCGGSIHGDASTMTGNVTTRR